jgi:SagB-type dehydrogenase family enzyme
LNAREYHDISSHIEAFPPAARRLDAALVPRPYKLYRDLRPLPVPAYLDTLLRYSNGIVRRRVVNGVERVYRAASCTGGAYHIEAYVITPDGVFHYGAHDHALRQLRSGDHRRAVANACAVEPDSHFYLVLTSVFYRNAWRYQERAYRHVFWDAGTVLANIEALHYQGALGLRAHLAFDDAAVDHILGLDPEKELAVCVVGLGLLFGSPPPASRTSPIERALVPASAVEIEYPVIAATHAAGALKSKEVAQWRGDLQPLNRPPSYGDEPITEIIERRTSARRFGKGPLPDGALKRILDSVNEPLPFDVVTPVTTTQVLPPDADATHLALDQAIAGEAAVNVYFTAELDAVLEAYGDRGYRLAQLEAGLRGGRAYLAATALNLRVTGLTFYDDAVKRVLGRDPMYLVAIGT